MFGRVKAAAGPAHSAGTNRLLRASASGLALAVLTMPVPASLDLANAAEVNAARRPGLELTVRLDTGRMIAVVQEDVGEPFRPGDRIRVASDGYRTRISH